MFHALGLPSDSSKTKSKNETKTTNEGVSDNDELVANLFWTLLSDSPNLAATPQFDPPPVEKHQ